MVLILLVSALRIFLLLLLMCTQRRRGRRDQQKVMSTRRRSPRRTRRVRKTRKTRSLVYSLTQNLPAEVILNNLLLVFLFQFILIQFLFLFPKPHNKHNHLLLTHPHRFQLPFHLHPYKKTTPIISTTSEQVPLVYLEVSDSETAQPIPLNHSFPPFTQQSDSDVTLNFSSKKSADFQFPDPLSPQIQSL